MEILTVYAWVVRFILWIPFFWIKFILACYFFLLVICCIEIFNLLFLFPPRTVLCALLNWGEKRASNRVAWYQGSKDHGCLPCVFSLGHQIGGCTPAGGYACKCGRLVGLVGQMCVVFNSLKNSIFYWNVAVG
jgi:hypothetical protein